MAMLFAIVALVQVALGSSGGQCQTYPTTWAPNKHGKAPETCFTEYAKGTFGDDCLTHMQRDELAGKYPMDRVRTKFFFHDTQFTSWINGEHAPGQKKGVSITTILNTPFYRDIENMAMCEKDTKLLSAMLAEGRKIYNTGSVWDGTSAETETKTDPKFQCYHYPDKVPTGDPKACDHDNVDGCASVGYMHLHTFDPQGDDNQVDWNMPGDALDVAEGQAKEITWCKPRTDKFGKDPGYWKEPCGSSKVIFVGVCVSAKTAPDVAAKAIFDIILGHQAGGGGGDSPKAAATPKAAAAAAKTPVTTPSKLAKSSAEMHVSGKGMEKVSASAVSEGMDCWSMGFLAGSGFSAILFGVLYKACSARKLEEEVTKPLLV